MDMNSLGKKLGDLAEDAKDKAVDTFDKLKDETLSKATTAGKEQLGNIKNEVEKHLKGGK